MDVEMRCEARERIAAPPERVYELVADVTRMGEWSPECRGAEWADGSEGPAVGARFNGHNRAGENEWTTPNEVIAADPGREFAWVVGSQERYAAMWRYRFEPDGDGTLVTESFELGPAVVGFRSMLEGRTEDEVERLVASRMAQLDDGMRRTLALLKETAESA